MNTIFNNPGIIAVMGMFGVPIIGIVCHYWHKVHKDRYDHDLKRAMIERGMSPQEIEQVLNAGNNIPKSKK